MDQADSGLPPIPAKRYFTIGEVSELCLVKPYVLRYWEQEFVQLKPMKRRGNRRYYQHHEVLLIRRIRELLYDQGFTISGARNQLADHGARSISVSSVEDDSDEPMLDSMPSLSSAVASASRGAEPRTPVRALQAAAQATSSAEAGWGVLQVDLARLSPESIRSLREALLEIRDFLA
ncbi:MAG TPA: MerR family transcriptional regulator [Aquabacterium sp.]|nr:MerR family transcriptional regulator [Aquabacterium sp.]